MIAKRATMSSPSSNSFQNCGRHSVRRMLTAATITPRGVNRFRLLSLFVVPRVTRFGLYFSLGVALSSRSVLDRAIAASMVLLAVPVNVIA